MHYLSKSNRNFTTKNPKLPSSNYFHRATIPLSLSLSLSLGTSLFLSKLSYSVFTGDVA
jgi:hypothetical protein